MSGLPGYINAQTPKTRQAIIKSRLTGLTAEPPPSGRGSDKLKLKVVYPAEAGAAIFSTEESSSGCGLLVRRLKVRLGTFRLAKVSEKKTGQTPGMAERPGEDRFFESRLKDHHERPKL